MSDIFYDASVKAGAYLLVGLVGLFLIYVFKVFKKLFKSFFISDLNPKGKKPEKKSYYFDSEDRHQDLIEKIHTPVDQR